MQIVGFGAQQLTASPQAFQSLSVGGNPPAPPAAPFGAANPDLVPVKATASSSVPVNLTLQALPAATAVAALQNAASNGGFSATATGSQQSQQQVASVTRPPVQESPANSTAFVGATVPNETQVTGSVTPPGAPPQQTPAAAVSFTVVAPPPDQTTTQQAAQTLTPQPQTGPPTPPPPFTLANSSDNSGTSQNQKTDASQPSQPAQTQSSSQTTSTANGTQAPTLPAAANPSLVQRLVSTVQSLLIGQVYPQPIFSFFA